MTKALNKNQTVVALECCYQSIGGGIVDIQSPSLLVLLLLVLVLGLFSDASLSSKLSCFFSTSSPTPVVAVYERRPC